eukprot:m.444454 g.444454  ORF g.444454 m.444454 type:complete len:534 (-) comp19101_c0_seq1:750-2351(-)
MPPVRNENGKTTTRVDPQLKKKVVTSVATEELGVASAEEGPEDASGDRSKFFSDVLQMLERRLEDTDAPVLKLASPEELRERMDLSIGADPRSYDDLAEACQHVLDYSVRTGHPHFHNQLFASVSPAGVAGELLTAVANASMYTYEVAPVFTVLENDLLERMRGLLGWKDGDGIFNPGGSISNLYAMNLARFRKCKEIGYSVKEDGLSGAPVMVCFASRDAHYSITKAAGLIGIGTKRVIKVDVDKAGRMIPEKLAEAIVAAKEAGQVPFMIQCTAGTTVLGSYDDIDAACDIAAEHKMWVHVDGCWGGSVALSKTHKHLLTGVERADSFAWNPHKMMGIPLQCCAFLTQELGILQEAHSANAKYLFQRDKLNANLDTGDKSLQCGRRNDALKLWMAWAAMGTEGYQRHIDNIWGCARYLRDEVLRRDGFKLVSEPMCTNVCFWYVPPSLRGDKTVGRRSQEWRDTVHSAAAKVKAELQRQGTLMVGYQSIPINGDKSPPNFFRMVVISMDSTHGHMDFLLNEIERVGLELNL